MSTHARGIAWFVLLIWASSSFGQDAYKEEVYQNLRDKAEVLPQFNFFGNDARQYVTPEAGGLHVIFPANRTELSSVGLQTKFKVAGDFEITGTYELLSADMPNDTKVAGVNLFVMQGPDGKRFGRLGRFSTNQGNLYAVSHTDRNTPAKRRRQPSEAKAGQLRFVREGSLVAAQVKDATMPDFTELYSTEFGNDELSVVRFAANTDNQPYALDARLVDLRIRSGGKVGGAAALNADKPAPIAPAKTEGSKGWLIAAIVMTGSFVVVVAFGVGIWFVLRQRKSVAQPVKKAKG